MKILNSHHSTYFNYKQLIYTMFVLLFYNNTIAQITNSNGFIGEFTVDKAVAHIDKNFSSKTVYDNFHSKTIKYIKWKFPDFISKYDIENFVTDRNYLKSEGEVLNVSKHPNYKILILKTESTEVGGGRVSYSFLYTIFLFENIVGKWYFKNYLLDKKSDGKYLTVDLGVSFGLLSTYESYGQGYDYESTSVFIPSVNNGFKKVIDDVETAEDNSGAVSDKNEIFKNRTIITSQKSSSRLNNLIFTKTGTISDDSNKIINVNEKYIYRFNGDTYKLN